MKSAGDGKPKTLLVVGARLPKRSETFVYREVFALRERGRTVHVASVHPPERGLGDARLERLAAEAIGVYGPGGICLLRDALLGFIGNIPNTLNTVGITVAEWLRENAWKNRRGWRVWVQLIGGIALAQRVKGLGLGHVHAHMAHVPATIALITARQLRIPFSFTGHAADLFRDASLLRTKLQAASFVACISRWHREFYRTLLPRGDSVYRVIRCGVEVPDSASDAASDPELKVVTVARLVPKKGIDLLLRAVAEMSREGHSFRLEVIGEGPEKQRLRELCNTLGIGPNVLWAGALSNTEVRTRLEAATLFVLPCRVDADGDRDGIPVVLMESMAAGVPCICGDQPPIRELIEDGKTGRLVRADDVLALKKAMLEMMRDVDLRRRCSENGKQRVIQEFSLGVNAHRFIEALDGGASR